MPFYGGGDTRICHRSLHGIMWEKLQSYGNEIAIVDASDEGKSITYRELLQNSRKCAAYLQSLGIKKGDYVSIFSANSLEFAYLTIGVIGSGAVLTPCKDFYQENEILYEFGITRPRAVFVDEDRLARLDAVKKKLPFLEHIFVIGRSKRYVTVDEVLAKAKPESLKEVCMDPQNDLVIAPYSSGTTGPPKCVLTAHAALLLTIQSQFYTGGGGTFYADRAMYHAGGFQSILGNILIGRRIIMEKEFVLRKLFEDIEKYRITVATCFPPTVIEMINAKDAEEYDLSSLKMIICAGAPIASAAVEQMRKRYRVTFVAGYAMTEAGFVSYGPITEADPMGAAGKIEPGVEVKIVDVETGKECEYGATGEIRVRSPQVTKGYLKNAGATATLYDEDGWLRTGDIGWIDQKGNLCITARIKEVIKYKTLQISPAELESVIIQHPGVSDVGVVGIPDAMCGEIPIAFVVPADGTLSIEDVHDIVNRNLADFKRLRGGVRFVSSIPKSPTGKIERIKLKKLPAVGSP